MNLKYKTIFNGRLQKLKAFVAGAAMLVGVSATAFPGGTYTVDPAGTASSTVYTNWKSLTNDLIGTARTDGGTANYSVGGNGLQGAIVIEVASGSTMTEQVEFLNVTSTSATNTITINGNGATLTFSSSASATAHTLGINNTKYITVRNYNIHSTNSTNGKNVWIWNNSDFVKIVSCTLTQPNMTSTSNNNAYIFISNGTTALSTYSDPGENITIDSNIMYSGVNYGPYSGIGIANESSGTTVHKYTITNNNIKDWYFTGLYNYYALNMTISNNEIWNNTSSTRTGTKYGLYLYNSSKGGAHTVTYNNIHDIFGTASTSSVTQYGIYLYAYNSTTSTGQGLNVSNNNVVLPNCRTSAYGLYLYGYNTNLGSYDCIVNDNYISIRQPNTSSTITQYGMYNWIPYYGTMNSFQMKRNEIRMLGAGGAYGIYNYAYNAYLSNPSNIENNVIYLEKDYYIYGVYNYSPYHTSRINMIHNTVYNSSNGPNTTSYAYILMPYYMEGDCKNNIVYTNGTWNTIYAIYAYYLSTPPTYGGNNVNLTNATGSKNYGYDNNGAYASITSWQGAGSGRNLDFETNPNLIDPANRNYTPISFDMANKGVATSVLLDIYGAARSASTPDPGAVEYFLDVEAVSHSMVGAPNQCGNYKTDVVVTFKNNSSFAIKNVPVAYTLNGGGKVTEIIPTTINPGASTTYTFAKQVTFNKPGANVVNIFVDGSDDVPANSSIAFNINITKSPTGGILTCTSPQGGVNNVIHNFGGFDVTVPTVSADYAIDMASSGLASSDWTAAVVVKDEITAATVSGSTSSKSGNTFNVQFDPPATSIDKFVKMYITFTDVNTGCDSTIEKRIFVAPRCVPSFTFPATVCEGDPVIFNNLSTVSTGNKLSFWNFTTNPADTANNISPVFTFPGSGVYDVKLTCITSPYGFQDELVQQVTVTPIPVVGFTRTNACEGNAVVLTNTTTPAGANYTWTLGDGSPTVSTANVNKIYANPGGYAVSLKAEKNGCAATITKNVYQFAKPTAAGSLVSGSCDNEVFTFKNTSTISIGAAGSLWDFDEVGAISTDKNPSHKFATFGTKNVQLRAVSEFGCTDDLNSPIVVNVKEAPKADFTLSPACSETPTTFTNISTMPTGSTNDYKWTIEGVTATNNNATFTHNWSGLGEQTITLEATATNGCVDKLSQTKKVLIQPIADFSVTDICQGKEATFTNLTTWPTGTISYDWNFGDNNTSTDGTPTHTYDASVIGQRNVTLTAKIAGGCESVKIIPVEIKEAPSTCDFDFVTNYANGATNMNLVPKGGSMTGTTYKWIYSFGGSDETVATGKDNVTFPSNAGSQKVTMIATKNGCECSITKENNHVNVETLANGGNYKVYPNPSNGVLNIEVANNNETLTIEIFNAVGAKIATVNTNNANNGTYTIDLSNEASGLYLVKVTAGNHTSTERITLTK